MTLLKINVNQRKLCFSYSLGLAIIDSVDKPEIMKDSIFQEVGRVMELDINGCGFHTGNNPRGEQPILKNFQVTIKLSGYTEQELVKSGLIFC